LCLVPSVAADAVLAALTSTDCDAWNKSQELAAAPDRDTVPTVTPTAIGSTSCVGSYCATITALSRIGSSSTYDYCIVWNTPTSTQGVVPTGRYAALSDGWVGGADYETTALKAADGPYWNVVQVCPAPPAGSHASMIGAQNGGTLWQYPLTAWRATEWSSATTATVSPPIVTYPDPARTIRCDITLSTGQVLSASTPTFHEGDANLPRPVYPAIPSGSVPMNTKCVETGGPQSLTLSQATTTSPYQSWMTNDKECANGSCLLDLRQNGASCFFSNADCDGWMTDPSRDTTYQCYIGTHAVVISECYIYGTTFNAADRASGHAYADPVTGGLVDGQTSSSDVDNLTASYLADGWADDGEFAVMTDEERAKAARAVAVACLSQVGILLNGVHQEGELPVIELTADDCMKLSIFAPGKDVEEATVHDGEAILAGQPSVLHYESNDDKSLGVRGAPLPSGWYNRVIYDNCGDNYFPPSTNCDEYPYYSTMEGGPGASLKNIDAADNQKEGRLLQDFRTACKVNADAPEFIVAPLLSNTINVQAADIDSVGICIVPVN